MQASMHLIKCRQTLCYVSRNINLISNFALIKPYTAFVHFEYENWSIVLNLLCNESNVLALHGYTLKIV